MGGTMDGGGDDGNNMPPSGDAPATTDTLTAGGGSDNDDDDDDDDSGGSGDDDNDNDKDKDNDKDNEPTSEDAPVTTDTLTAKKIECPAGQEYYLFSTSCEPTGGGADSTQGTTSAATVCPTSPIPTSYGMPDQSSVTNTVWGFSEVETEQREMQQSLLRRVQGSTGEFTPANPANCPPGRDPARWLDQEPPQSASPYRGNEIELIEFYGNPDPTNPAIVHTDKQGNYVHTTFADDTIKTAKLTTPDTENDDDDPIFIEQDVSITPGPGTPLDKLGVLQVKIPNSGYGGFFIDVNTIKYKDGKSVEKK